MASQIYSRYIPPRKTKPTEISHEKPNIPLAVEPTPPLIKQSASSVYSRYIPPPKSKAQDDALITSPKRKRELDLDLEKPKKAKKVKQDTKDTQVEAPPLSPIRQSEELRSNVTEKKSKKKARKSLVTEDATPYDAVQMDPKHQKVMERRDKSLRKAEKIAKKEAKKSTHISKDETEDDVLEEPAELHDLVPLPQPEPVPEAPIQAASASLPPWLANPIRVSPTSTAAFSDLGIHKDVIKVLNSKGFKEAFAVQAAVLPLLLPGKSQITGDILVSAATGSGKTLSYVLPMIENLSHICVTRLRGLIIMPTRELVAQAREVCEVCAAAFSSGDRRRIKIGTAVGNESFKVEQALLMDQEDRYDPDARQEQERRLNEKWESSSRESHDGDDDALFDDEPVSRLPDHVIDHLATVDILICTPGRLVEHLKSTPGFTLKYVKWLIVDEADKLLDQTYQNWLDVVVNRVSSNSSLRQHVRKCILSATMTRDVGQLSGLKLHRPQLVVEQSSSNTAPAEGLVLPSTLVESGVRVEEESLKPLYLMELLSRESMFLPTAIMIDSSSDSEDDSDDEDSTSDESSVSTSPTSKKDKPHHVSAPVSKSETPHGVLIFTKSNETAVRLGRLLAILEPKYTETIGTLTSTTRSSTRKSTINSFNTGKISILVASDLVSRGLDLRNLAHVINYDMPTSITNYVHRVGRTARAGKKGCAWTLFTPTEGRWFWHEIGRSEAIQRLDGEKIKRVTIKADSFDEDARGAYEAALEELGKEANVGKSGRAKK